MRGVLAVFSSLSYCKLDLHAYHAFFVFPGCYLSVLLTVNMKSVSIQFIIQLIIQLLIWCIVMIMNAFNNHQFVDCTANTSQLSLLHSVKGMVNAKHPKPIHSLGLGGLFTAVK